MRDQAVKAERLRDLHRGPGIFVLPNAWDAVSARIFEAAGFPAVGTSSAGVANALGYPDGERVPRDEMLFVLRRMAATVHVPVTADVESGYGATVDEVVATVRAVIEAGVVGINLEDGTKQGARRLLPIAEQVARIDAIRALCDAMGVPLVINARTDAYLLRPEGVDPFDEAVERANAYLAADADCAFPIMVKDLAEIERLVRAIDGPVNVLALPGTPPVAELDRIGVRRVSVGSGPCRASIGLTRRIAEQLRDAGTYAAFMDGAMPSAEANGLFG